MARRSRPGSPRPSSRSRPTRATASPGRTSWGGSPSSSSTRSRSRRSARTSSRSTRRSSRTSRSAARRSTASPATPSGPSRRSARSSASRSSSCRTSSPRARRAARSASCTPAASRERALVMTGPDGVVLWSHQAEIARRAARREPDLRRPRRRLGLSLTSAPPPEPGPGDHVRGPEGARAVIVYGDYECPFCAALEARLHELELRVTFRHFPVRSEPPARAGGRARRRGGRAAGRVLAVPRRAVRRPGAPGGPAPVGARGGARARPRALRRRPPLRRGRRAGARGLPRRDPRGGGDDADAVRGRRPPRRAGPARSCGRRCARP